MSTEQEATSDSLHLRSKVQETLATNIGSINATPQASPTTQLNPSANVIGVSKPRQAKQKMFSTGSTLKNTNSGGKKIVTPIVAHNKNVRTTGTRGIFHEPPSSNLQNKG